MHCGAHILNVKHNMYIDRIRRDLQVNRTRRVFMFVMMRERARLFKLNSSKSSDRYVMWTRKVFSRERHRSHSGSLRPFKLTIHILVYVCMWNICWNCCTQLTSKRNIRDAVCWHLLREVVCGWHISLCVCVSHSRGALGDL